LSHKRNPGFGPLPAFDTVRSPVRGIDASHLRTVLHAILRGMDSSGFMASKDFSPRVPYDKISKWPKAKKHNNEDFATTVGYEAQQCFTAHRLPAKLRSAGDCKPSLSQWLDLVGELEADNTNALTHCLHPTTSGGRRREYGDAKSSLHKLDRIPTPKRTLHARFLVQRLAAEMHAFQRDG